MPTHTGEIVATGLEFPEGPVWRDGEVWVTEIVGGRISAVDTSGTVRRVADTGGGPNGATLGPDGALWVTQNGGMLDGARATAGIQRVAPDGSVTQPFTEVGGVVLDGPNDLAFGPDGRLWFTDPRGSFDPAVNDRPGRLFAVDVDSGDGEVVAEVGPAFPNGIGFDVDGALWWTESFTRHLMRMTDGSPEVVFELPERSSPDGFCFGADGLVYVASTYAHCISVIDVSGPTAQIVERLMCGDGMATNCCFGGTDLYVTESRRGTVWRYELGVGGLPLR